MGSRSGSPPRTAAGVEVGERGRRALDGHRLGEGVAADGELGDDVEVERLGVEVDGAVQVGDGDPDVVGGWVGHA